MTQTRFKGRIKGKGLLYASGCEQLTVDLRKADAKGLPFQENTSRKPIDLMIGSDSYRAGLKFDRGTQTVYISPDVVDIDNRKTNLATALDQQGFQKNDEVWLNYEQDGRIRIERVVG